MTEIPADGATTLRHARLLRDLLATDVQDYPPLITEIEAAVQGIRNGTDPGPHHFSGNIYTLTLAEREARVVNAHDTRVPPETMSLDAFDAAFHVWVAQHRTA